MVEQDLPMLADWLREEHVQRWWKDPNAADDAEAHYLPRILGLVPTEMFVIVWDDRDIGMIQRYRLDEHPDWERSLVPSGLRLGIAAGIDYAIGVPEFVGRGIGSTAIAAF